MFYASEKLVWLPLYLLIVYFIAREYKWKTLWWLLAIAFVVLLADQISVQAFKNVFHRLRPCHNPDLKELVHLVGRRGGLYGFISSHAANTFGVAVFLSFLFSKRWVTIGILFWAAFVSYSRIYLGVHYPGDVLVGAIVGAGVGSAVWFIASKIFNKSKK
jgi:undecaprenyl-diphosphatase